MFWRRQKQARGALVSRDSFLETVTPVWSVKDSELKLVENGFEWLPGNHTVRVFVHEDARKLSDPPGVRITVATDYRRWVPVRDRQFVKLAGLSANLCCSTYSWVYPPGDIADEFFAGRPTDLDLFASAYITEPTSRWLPTFFAQMALMQPINAEIQSAMGGLVFGDAQPALARRPKVTNINEILNAVRDVIAPEGQKPSAWLKSGEFEDFIDTYARSDRCVGAVTDYGMVFETPFGSESAAVMFRTDVQHPQLGQGLLIATLIDAQQIPHNTFDEAATLNFLESRFWTDIPQLGCWHPHGERHNLAHSIFIPNAMYVPNLVAHFAHWALDRVEWVLSQRFPKIRSLPMSDIMERRLKKS
jgi:hypothetical protein